MTTFAKSPAFPQSAVYDPTRDAAGADGLRVRRRDGPEHPTIRVADAVCRSTFPAGDVSDLVARNWADQSLLTALERLKELA